MIKPTKLHFATAGIPNCLKGKDYIDALEFNHKNNLMAMELEFVHGVKMKEKNIPIIKDFTTKNNMLITAHAPFYINLNAQEEEKKEASIKRILDTARLTHQCGGYSITFHAAYYLGQSSEKVYNVVKESLEFIVSTLKSEGIEIWIRPELTGKATQFGSMEELIRLSNDVEMVLPCVDFSHYHARLNGYNGYDKFATIFETMAKEMGEGVLDNFHGHLAGIEYSAKGEKRHLNLEESDLLYKDLLKCLKEFNVKGVLVCESPNIELDAIMMYKEYNSN